MISVPTQSIIIKAKVSVMKYRKKRKEYKLYYVRVGKHTSIQLEKMGTRRLKNVEIIYQNEKYMLGDIIVRICSRANDNTAMYGFTIPKQLGEKLAGKKVLIIAEIDK